MPSQDEIQAILQEYTVEDFLSEAMDTLREKFECIDHLHPGQVSHVWDRLIKEIESERDGG